MTKKSLGQLLAEAKTLQAAARLTKDFGQLNSTIVEILAQYYLVNQVVKVDFDPKRPQAWEGDPKDERNYALLRIIHGGLILRIPVPELETTNRKVSEKVRDKMNANEAVKNVVDKIRTHNAKALQLQQHVREVLAAKGYTPGEDLVAWIQSEKLDYSYGMGWAINLDYPGRHAEIPYEARAYGSKMDIIDMSDLRLNSAELPELEHESLLVEAVLDPQLRTQILQSLGCHFQGLTLVWEKVEELYRALALNYERSIARKKLAVHIGGPENVVRNLIAAWAKISPDTRKGKNWVYRKGRPAQLSFRFVGAGDDVNDLYESPDAISEYEATFTFVDGTLERENFVTAYGNMPDMLYGMVIAEVPRR